VADEMQRILGAEGIEMLLGAQPGHQVRSLT
jgi:hypothetical protein